ncbi:MAG: hypothetical protein J6O50_15690 [Ruminiclostridium sp.]|nr:hypothetical protein [Ruminiclostridium sp.]
MAKIQCELYGDFDMILNALHNAVIGGSLSASLEESSDFYENGARCAVRIYERYSMFGSNRLSMSVTLFEANGRVYISAAATGGSQAMFIKINTVGEHSFLDTVRKTIGSFSVRGYGSYGDHR